MVGLSDARGSMWRRWDPHIHSPGTVLEDRFGGDWDGYLKALESSTPQILALGITDYCVLDSYEAVRSHKAAGRLPDVQFIFPNVELRYDIGTPKGSALNAHLLVNSGDPNHLEELKRFLSSLTFRILDHDYRCEKRDLIRLGEDHDPNTRGAEKAALRTGVKQFKVNREQLHTKWETNPWARENILVGISVSNKDGTAALQYDDSFTSVRRDIERFAHIIFSGQENQRTFWLGEGGVQGREFIEKYGGPKPCIHGDDAHSLEQVGHPRFERYTWIKGDATFESLRQICFEPETRVFIGPQPPAGALASEVISSVSVSHAPWLKGQPIPLNPGLVGIIGARGSGKTALADIIAAGGDALRGHLNDKSFAKRAEKYLPNSSAHLLWEDGDETSSPILFAGSDRSLGTPRVQYLSQQFVDLLCSSEGLADRLLLEIKRVVFEAHPPESRLGTASFDELLDLHTMRSSASRSSFEDVLESTVHELLAEWQRQAGLKTLQERRDELVRIIEKDKSERTRFIGAGSDERVKQLDAVSRAADAVLGALQKQRRQQQSLLSLRDEIENLVNHALPLRLMQLRQAFSEAALSEEEWKAFTIRLSGPANEVISLRLKEVEGRIQALTGPNVRSEAVGIDEAGIAKSALLANTELENQTYNALQHEITRLRALIGIDNRNATTVKRLSEKISKDENTLAQIDREISAAEKSPERMAELNVTRETAYAGVFGSIAQQEEELRALYEPLRARLGSEKGALQKLSFAVRRRANLQQWTERGEGLLDLRKSGPFQGHGALIEKARGELLEVWELGSSREAAEAINKFRNRYEKGLLQQANVDRGDREAFRVWWGDISRWLWSTDHISVSYSIQYDGIGIEQLSPGTRGIVLLLLYLAIDNTDDRPMIIDQPEENLDPKSIHDELVLHFRKAKQRRQIIIVTHNANLIVNADADQVIVADCGPHQHGRLPDISYMSGGLENPKIRKRVCDILEGGATAFEERAKRLRIWS